MGEAGLSTCFEFRGGVAGYNYLNRLPAIVERRQDDQALVKLLYANPIGAETKKMRNVWMALVAMALSSPVKADECRIVWWDLFLPHSEAEFEKLSEVNAKLTLKNTGKLEPISFELALTSVPGEDGKELDLLLSTQTLVSSGLSNQVTVTLQAKKTSWLVGFDSAQTIRTKDGKTFGGETRLAGWLTCNQLRP